MTRASRADGLCPRCGKEPAMVRDIENSFYGPALLLAAEMERRDGIATPLPPPLCEGRLDAFRGVVGDSIRRDSAYDDRLWQELRAGRISPDEFTSRVNDRHTYEAGVEAIRLRLVRRSSQDGGGQ